MRESAEPELIFDRDILIKNILRFKKSVNAELRDKKVMVYYAIKANHDRQVLDIIADYNLGAEILSDYELRMIPENMPVQINGHMKSRELLEAGTRRKNCIINIEDISELYRIAEIAESEKIKIGIRIKAESDSRIGMDEQNIMKACAYLKQHLNIRLCELHFHAGWNIKDDAVYEGILKRMRSIHNQIISAGEKIDCWNLGGSFAEPSLFPKQVHDRLKLLNKYIPDDVSTICFEPGRYFAGNAGKLVTRVMERRENQIVINASTYGYMLTGGTPLIEHISDRTGKSENLKISKDKNDICISGIWPCENDCLFVSACEAPIEVEDILIFHNMGAYIDGTFSTLFHEKILSYKYTGKLYGLLKEGIEAEKAVICKYYNNGSLVIPQNKTEKHIIFEALIRQFTVGKGYTEKEVNDILSKYYFDFCFLRREMVEKGLFQRRNDGKTYERIQ